MFPYTVGRWWHAHEGGCGDGFGRHHGSHRHGGGHGDDGGSFGVRRPLRFLAHRLELDERQTAELARILDEVKTERAQALVDERRAASAFADALCGDMLDAPKLGEAAASRVRSAERLREAIVTALGRIHALLNQEQRQRLAFLVRTGAVQF
ncbi:MAG TPA: Spy/CpxP family protein refolding chaperone [Anaeromyxobacteraceae bacterium]|nr:Spy/CpxP family protein refolding chaperone [Anaeromyxobacteraceae bacterium]